MKKVLLMGMILILIGTVSAGECNTELNGLINCTYNTTELPVVVEQELVVDVSGLNETNFIMNISSLGYVIPEVESISLNEFYLQNVNYNVPFDVYLNLTPSLGIGQYYGYVFVNVDPSISNNTIQFEFLATILNGTINGTNTTIPTNTTNSTNTTDPDTNTTQPPPDPDVSFVQLGVNEFEYTFCDYSLPTTASKQLTVYGNYNDTIQTRCEVGDEFIDCPDEVYIGPQNYTEIQINISIPNGTTHGRYSSVVEFSIVDEFANATFFYVINVCDIPIRNITEIIERDFSLENLTTEEYFEFLERMDDYVVERILALQQANKTKQVNVTVVENNTEYVPVFPLGKEALAYLNQTEEIIRLNKQLLTENRQLKLDLKEASDNVSNSKEELLDTKYQGETQALNKLDPLLKQNQNLTQTIEEYEQTHIPKNYIIIPVIIVIIVGGIFGFIQWRKNAFFF